MFLMKHDPFYPRQEGPNLGNFEVEDKVLSLMQLVDKGKKLISSGNTYVNLEKSIVDCAQYGFKDLNLEYDHLGSKSYTVNGADLQEQFTFTLEKRIWTGDVYPQLRLWFIADAVLKADNYSKEANIILDPVNMQMVLMVDSGQPLDAWLKQLGPEAIDGDYAFVGMVSELSNVNKYLEKVHKKKGALSRVLLSLCSYFK